MSDGIRHNTEMMNRVDNNTYYYNIFQTYKIAKKNFNLWVFIMHDIITIFEEKLKCIDAHRYNRLQSKVDNSMKIINSS